MPQPAVAIVGRPNVGKSTLFNRLVGRRSALVDDRPGVTRDRREGDAKLLGLEFKVIDTAGYEDEEVASLPGRMRQQTQAAVRSADVALFLLDAREGVTPMDEEIARWLRAEDTPVVLVGNKAESSAASAGLMEAYSLGFDQPVAISAEHGEGVVDLFEALRPFVERPEEEEEPAPFDDEGGPLKLAIVGRPNAGKSTLVNQMVGEERMITGPEPGLTRDAVSVEWRDATGGRVRLVDTAGMRKRARVEQKLEQMSVGASIAALKEAEVVILVVDALLGMDEQDLRIARLAEREGRAVVVALNKWDAVEDRNAARRRIEDVLTASLAQLRGLTVVPLSAATGRGVDKLMPAVRETHALWNRRIPTGELNRWFEGALARHPPPLVEGRRIKLRYATMPKARPPTIAVFGTRAEQLPEDWRRYLVNSFREAFKMPGVPVRLNLRGTTNPYEDAD